MDAGCLLQTCRLCRRGSGDARCLHCFNRADSVPMKAAEAVSTVSIQVGSTPIATTQWPFCARNPSNNTAVFALVLSFFSSFMALVTTEFVNIHGATFRDSQFASAISSAPAKRLRPATRFWSMASDQALASVQCASCTSSGDTGGNPCSIARRNLSCSSSPPQSGSLPPLAPKEQRCSSSCVPMWARSKSSKAVIVFVLGSKRMLSKAI